MEAEIFPLFSDLPSSRRIVQRHQMQFAHSGSLPGFAVLGTLHRSDTPGVYPSGQRGQAVNLLAYAFGGFESSRAHYQTPLLELRYAP